MGIRVIKCIGYGLTDIKREKSGRWCDPRIKKDYVLWENELHTDGFHAYLKNIKNKSPELDEYGDVSLLMKAMSKGSKFCSLNDCLAHDYETEDSGNLVIIPPEYLKESRRYDDLIDYYECPYGEKVTLLNRTIYPYDSWMDSRTGLRIKDAHERVGMVNYFAECPEPGQPDKYLKVQGYESLESFKSIVVPLVPMSVRWLCEYAGIFKDPKTVLSLRPMIYSYWS